MSRVTPERRPERRPARPHGHRERHYSGRGAWLRAGVLGANDGLLSVASLMVGVASSGASRGALFTAGFAAVAGGALSMAVGEYSSVSSQRDTELADLERERTELRDDPHGEAAELANIYRKRGLSPALAQRVADELSAQPDQLSVHAREELGLDLDELARPVQAAAVSAVSFTIGALLPIVVMAVASVSTRVWLTVLFTLAGLAALGGAGAHLGGAPKGRAALRVLVGGALAMAVTSIVGKIAGTVV